MAEADDEVEVIEVEVVVRDVVVEEPDADGALL